MIKNAVSKTPKIFLIPSPLGNWSLHWPGEIINNRHVSEKWEREGKRERWLAGLGWGCVTAGIQRWQTGLIKAQSFSPITAAHWSLRQDRALDRPAEEWSDCRPRGRIPGQREGTKGAPLICLRCIWFLSTKSRGGRPALIVHSYVHEREIRLHSFDALFWWAGECVIWASQLLKLTQHAEETAEHLHFV